MRVRAGTGLRLAVVVVAALAAARVAGAELLHIEVGGSLQIRGDWYRNAYVSPNVTDERWPGIFLPKRPIGMPDNTIFSDFAWDKRAHNLAYASQRVTLNARAEFTRHVAAFIELDSYDYWGEDFRADPITGAAWRADSSDDVEVYQAYIEAGELAGMPLQLRVGRQEIILGSGWLVGNNDCGSIFTRLSFDALRLTWTADLFELTAFAAKLFENGPFEQDGDVDFYGVYGSFTGIEEISLDAYWLFLRDARAVRDTALTWFPERLERAFGVDDYDVTRLHTVGLRAGGVWGAFDFEVEAAYQFGDADQVGAAFAPLLYGDSRAEFGAWAGHLELGYTFDTAWTPRVFVGGAYLGGEDRRKIGFVDWMNPFYRPRASVSFNRLFSNWGYGEFVDFSDMVNTWVACGGLSVQPVESVSLSLLWTYSEALDAFEAPVHFRIGRYRVPVAPMLSWWTTPNPRALGWELEAIAEYAYSESLSFEAGYARLFVGEGLARGHFNVGNGLWFTGGSRADDADYAYIETRLQF